MIHSGIACDAKVGFPFILLSFPVDDSKDPTYICQSCDASKAPAKLPNDSHDHTHDLVLFREASLDPIPLEDRLVALEAELRQHKNQLKEQMSELKLKVDDRIEKMEKKMGAMSLMLNATLAKLVS